MLTTKKWIFNISKTKENMVEIGDVGIVLMV